MSDKIAVTLSERSLSVNVGEFTTLIATVCNNGQFVDEFAIAIEGLDSSWYDLSATDVLLPPGQEGRVRIIIHPSKTAKVKGGSHPFKIKVSSMVDAALATAADVSVMVHTIAGLSANMSPAPTVGRGGTYSITLSNESKEDIVGRLEASDPKDELDFSFDSDKFLVRAGGDVGTRLYVLPKDWASVKEEKEYSFQVVVRPSGEGESVAQAEVLNGRMVYKPKLRAAPSVKEGEVLDKIGVVLSSTDLKAKIGEFTELIATIRNNTGLVDQFSVSIEGIDSTWYGFSATDVLLSPGDEGMIRIIIHLPKAAGVRAGNYSFKVKVTSMVDALMATVMEASLTVYTFSGLSAEMTLESVVGRIGTYTIVLSNQSKASVTEGIEASDPGDELTYTFKPREIYISPGGKVNVELCVQPKEKVLKQGLGELRKEKDYSFQVVVKPVAAAGASVETMMLNGHILYKPTYPAIPKFKLGIPSLPKFKRAIPALPKAKPEVPAVPEVKPGIPIIPEAKPEVPAVPVTKPSIPAVPVTKPGIPAVSKVKPEVPVVPEVKPGIPAVSKVKPGIPVVPEVKPGIPAVSKVKPEVPVVPEVKPEVPAVPKVKPGVPAIPKVKPSVPAVPKFKPSIPAVPKFKPSIPAVPKVKPSIPAIPKFRPGILDIPAVPKIKLDIPVLSKLVMSRRMVGATASAIVLVVSSILLQAQGASSLAVTAFEYEPGESGYTLSWDVRGATRVYVADEIVDTRGGTIVVRPVERTEYMLVATSGKGTVNASVIITPPPTIQVFKAELIKGSFLLTWSVKGAGVVYLNAELVDHEGEMKISPEESTEYILSASNDIGEAEQSVTIVPPSGEVSLLTPASGAKIVAGSECDITWNSSGIGIDHVGILLSAVGVNWQASGSIGVSEQTEAGTYVWTVPDYQDAVCTVKVVIYDAAGNILDEDTASSVRITGGTS